MKVGRYCSEEERARIVAHLGAWDESEAFFSTPCGRREVFYPLQHPHCVPAGRGELHAGRRPYRRHLPQRRLRHHRRRRHLRHYRFDSANMAERYNTNGEPHAFGAGRSVFRSIPVSKFKFPRFGAIDRETEKIAFGAHRRRGVHRRHRPDRAPRLTTGAPERSQP